MSIFSVNSLLNIVNPDTIRQSRVFSADIVNNSEADAAATFSSTRIDELSVTKQIEDVQKRLSRMLLSHNINTSQEINFKMSADGRIVVDGATKDKEQIERVLNENSQFVNDVKSMLNNSHELATSKDQQKYSIALNEKDDEDEKKQETEFEKQLRLHEKAVSFEQQLSNASGSFSFGGGKISVTTLNLAAGFSF